MNEKLASLSNSFNALSTRERVIIVVAVLTSLLFLWWNFHADPLIQQSRELEQRNNRLATEIDSVELASQAIARRLAEGVHKDKLVQIERGESELQRVNDQLEQKAYELVEPDEMFELMGQLLFADSGLKLGQLGRKQVVPVFAAVEGQEQRAADQPAIYRHTMTVTLNGRYADILRYLQTIEQTDWKLLWDSIRLETAEYPAIEVSLELSTLSRSSQWVGL